MISAEVERPPGDAEAEVEQGSGEHCNDEGRMASFTPLFNGSISSSRSDRLLGFRNCQLFLSVQGAIVLMSTTCILD
jgi:hypothetical protein